MSSDDPAGANDTYAFDQRRESDARGFRPSGPYAASGTGPVAASEGRGSGLMDARSARRAHLRVTRVSPWSATKFAFIVSLVCFVVLFVAVAVLYGVLAILGVFEAVGSVVGTVVTSGGGDLFAPGRILGYVAFLGAINVVLFTLLGVIGAYIYNLTADLVGGIEVTLSERD